MKDRKYYNVATDNFPLLLGSSPYKPKQLYALGTLPAPTQTNERRNSTGPVGIAMVGTRRPSASAAELCRRLVFSLRGTNAVIVSGLAQGIDSLCHEAALEAGLPTIAVLAQGLEANIEGSRGELAKRILNAGGALVSEYDGAFESRKGTFVRRNRIISGLCQATLVIQSKATGGALITADLCIKEGKPLYAIPGEFDNEVAAGPNNLLDRGIAKPIFIPESLSQVLGLPKANGIGLTELSAIGCNLSPNAIALFKQVNGFRKTFNELESEFDFNTNTLLAILTELEMAGLAHTEDNYQFQFNGAV
ncbi:MAG: DNA-protecting protein DprA [Fibrobacter sp.]|nr:DNA-protecting protein DprA [Fibrobacter sp.]